MLIPYFKSCVLPRSFSFTLTKSNVKPVKPRSITDLNNPKVVLADLQSQNVESRSFSLKLVG